ncbi:MAG: amidohydrolase family protein [Bacteroidetes bacterium]|nr:amidohydrolase family protein [Bacteroidota bacterium]MCL5025094.1 amidohydrolase family protein [Chloroflexota bacterium]
MENGAPYGLLLKGGEVIDLASGVHGRYDVAFAGDRVAAIEPNIDASLAEQVRDVAGSMVVPGLIDIHVHACEGIGLSAHPDVVGVGRGATTVVDGGSAGAATFGLVRRVLMESVTRTLEWLCISTVGQIDTSVPECLFIPWMNVEKAVATAQANPDLIVGFKARLSRDAVGSTAMPALKLLLEAGEAAGLPVLVHVGETGEPLGQILDMLRPGDVVSHYLTGKRHGILGVAPLEGNKIIPEAFAARERGVILDVSRGRLNACFPAMQAAVEQGLLPDTLSTDLTKPGAASDPYLGLPMIATHFMSFGVPFENLLPRMTTIPARVLRREELGCLEVGGIGDATVLKFEEGEFTLSDVDGRTRVTDRRLVAVAAVRAGAYLPVA